VTTLGDWAIELGDLLILHCVNGRLNRLVSSARSEYLETPGLRVTLAGGPTRGIDAGVSALVLTRLMQCGFLWRMAQGAYVRRSSR
jgi:hypothetical protein